MKSFYLKYFTIVSLSLISLLVIFSLLVLSNKINSENSNFVYLMGTIILFISGFLLSNHYQKQGFLIGSIQAICFLVLFCLLNILAYNQSISFNILIKFAIYLLSGTLGGVLGVNIKKIV